MRVADLPAACALRKLSTGPSTEIVWARVEVPGVKPYDAGMAEIIRLNEPPSEPVSPSLPQNIEAEAALLGALMIDNRLVEDVQLRLKPHHFFEPLHGRIYESILRMAS